MKTDNSMIKESFEDYLLRNTKPEGSECTYEEWKDMLRQNWQEENKSKQDNGIVNESLEDARERMNPFPISEHGDSHYHYAWNRGFSWGSNWQKIQSEEQLLPLLESHAELLEVCYKSLQTYGEHPLIDKQVKSAIEKANQLTNK